MFQQRKRLFKRKKSCSERKNYYNEENYSNKIIPTRGKQNNNNPAVGTTSPGI